MHSPSLLRTWQARQLSEARSQIQAIEHKLSTLQNSFDTQSGVLKPPGFDQAVESLSRRTNVSHGDNSKAAPSTISGANTRNLNKDTMSTDLESEAARSGSGCSTLSNTVVGSARSGDSTGQLATPTPSSSGQNSSVGEPKPEDSGFSSSSDQGSSAHTAQSSSYRGVYLRGGRWNAQVQQRSWCFYQLIDLQYLDSSWWQETLPWCIRYRGGSGNHV